MKKVMVTGAAGFIGSHFVKEVLAQKLAEHVISVDKLTYAGNKKNLSGLSDTQHHFILGDIADKKLMQKIITHEEIDTIVNFAAETHVDNSIIAPEDFINTNIVGTYTLLEAAKTLWIERKFIEGRPCRFHHISTDEVYGELKRNQHPFTEKSAYQPSSPYSASKASADHLVRAYHRTFRLPVTISNCSNNFGPNQHHEKLIPTIIRSCIHNNAIPIYGKGKNIRDWLYVKDHCQAILKILAHGRVGETYNIGGNNEWENVALVKKLCAMMDKLNGTNAPHERLVKFVNDRPGHDFRYAIDNYKIAHDTNWKPSNNFSDHLATTINFYLEEAGNGF